MQSRPQQALGKGRGTAPCPGDTPCLQTGLSPWSESLCFKGSLTFLFPEEEKRSEGIHRRVLITGGREGRGKVCNQMSEHGWQCVSRMIPSSKMHLVPQSVT